MTAPATYGAPTTIDPRRRAETVAARIERVRELSREAGATGARLTTRRDTAWLTLGGELHVVLESEDAVAPILITADRAVVLSPVNEAARLADEELEDLPLEVVPVPWHEDLRIAATGVFAGVADGDGLLSGAALEAVLELERSRLGPDEHERLRWLGRLTEGALESARTVLAEDLRATETEVAARLVGLVAEFGVRTPVVLAAADERIERYRHPLPRDRQSKRRLMVVLVAERWGLHAAGTVLVDVAAVPEDLAARDAAVRRVLDAMNAASRPGTTLGGVLDATRAAYAAEGFAEEWKLHHQGGTIGYRGRERIAVPDDPFVLEPGMALAWNPSITGTKVETTLLIRPDDDTGIGRLEVIVPPIHLAATSSSSET